MKLFTWWFSGTTNAKRAKILTAVVALFAFVASYNHIFELIRDVGGSALVALITPLIVDLSVVAGIYLGLAAAERGRRRSLWAWLLLWAGSGATIGANLASAENGLKAQLVSLIAPVFLIITLEGMANMVRTVEQPEPEASVKPMTAREMVRANPSITVEEIVSAKGCGERYAERIIREESAKEL
jgi:hypothetical protein